MAAKTDLQILRQRVRHMLRLDSDVPESRAKQHQWQVRVIAGGQLFTVGKGDVNTIFYQVGTNEKRRRTCYPDEIETVLDAWCSNKYVSYYVGRDDDLSGPFSLSRALKQRVVKRHFIYGVRQDNVREPVYEALHNVTDKLVWTELTTSGSKDKKQRSWRDL
jgi:hypothetical protein